MLEVNFLRNQPENNSEFAGMFKKSKGSKVYDMLKMW